MSKLLERYTVITGYDKGTKVELHRFENGDEHYIGRTRLGIPFNIEKREEAEKIIKNYKMVRVI